MANGKFPRAENVAILAGVGHRLFLAHEQFARTKRECGSGLPGEAGKNTRCSATAARIKRDTVVELKLGRGIFGKLQDGVDSA